MYSLRPQSVSSSSSLDSTSTTITIPDACPPLQHYVPSISCHVCSGAHPTITGKRNHLSGADEDDGLLGRIVRLPSLETVTQHNTCVNQQLLRIDPTDPTRLMNDTAFNHPCLILAQSTCEHQVFCAPITSFGGNGIEAKYCRGPLPLSETIKQKLGEYISLRFVTDVMRKPHSDKGDITYEGEWLEYAQSYVHLDFGFWIEWRNLDRWDGKRKLTADSLSTITRLYYEAESARKSNSGSRGLARLSRRMLSPVTSSFSLSGRWSQIQSTVEKIAVTSLPSPSDAYVPPHKRPVASSASKREKMCGSWR